MASIFAGSSDYWAEVAKTFDPHSSARDKHITGYPAFFDHCSVVSMRKLFDKVGFVNINAKPYYGANDYFVSFVPAYLLVTLFEWACSRWRWSIFASGFVISAEKP